jgi:RNA polymerase sigma factor for flagellar operon FliA
VSVYETLSAALGRTPTVEEAASALGVHSSVVEAALADAARTVTSLDDAVVDSLATESLSPEESILADERLKYIREAVKALPERMRYVVEEIYFRDRTVKDIAAELGSTHAAVSQQRSEAIRLMRDGLATHYADDPSREVEVQSRITPRRRNAYLSQLSEATLGGISRSAFPSAVAFNEAV